jgi:hypothetical protein
MLLKAHERHLLFSKHNPLQANILRTERKFNAFVSENGWEYYYIIKGLYMSNLGLNAPGQYFRNIHGDICLGRF